MPEQNKTPPPPQSAQTASQSPPPPGRATSKSPNPYIQHQLQQQQQQQQASHKQPNQTSPPPAKSPSFKTNQRIRANRKRRWAAEYRRLAIQRKLQNQAKQAAAAAAAAGAAGGGPGEPQAKQSGGQRISRKGPPTTLWRSPLKSPQRRPSAAKEPPLVAGGKQLKSSSSQRPEGSLAGAAAAAGKLVPAAKKSEALAGAADQSAGKEPPAAQTSTPTKPADQAHQKQQQHQQQQQATTPIAYSPQNAFAYYNSKTPESLMNVHRLTRDGRKVPEQYRTLAQMASSPSQLSLRSISEYYNVPNSKFNSINDVFRYRGYRKLNKIDEGAFGVVSKATRMSDGLVVAVKEVDLSRKRHKRIEEMKRELFVLQKIDSPLIVKLMEHFIVSQTLVIIMEFCAGNNLTAYLKESAIGEEEAQMLFKQMAASIKILHRKGIAHRDVKLNNFLLDNSRKLVKVADFGLSVVSYRKAHGIIMAKTYCGTEPYMAPEILRRNSMGVRSYNPLYADVWSLGVCLFAMLTRTFPFKMNLSQRSLYRAQSSRRWRFPRNLRDSLSDDLRDIIWHMLDPEPERRISMNGIVAHPWLNPNETIELSQDES